MGGLKSRTRRRPVLVRDLPEKSRLLLVPLVGLYVPVPRMQELDSEHRLWARLVKLISAEFS